MVADLFQALLLIRDNDTSHRNNNDESIPGAMSLPALDTATAAATAVPSSSVGVRFSGLSLTVSDIDRLLRRLCGRRCTDQVVSDHYHQYITFLTYPQSNF